MVETTGRGIRLAALLITVASLGGFALPLLIANLATYRSPDQELVAFGLLTAVTLITGTALARNIELKTTRWLLLAATVVASVLAVTGVHTEQVMSESEWSYGLIGWFGLLLLLDKSTRGTFVFLGAHVALSLTYVAATGNDVAGFVVVTTVVLGYQVPFVVATMILRKLAADVAASAARDEQVRTTEAIADQLHADRKARYAALAHTAVPLLENLGKEPPEKAKYAVEAARMRRLFAEHDDVPDPLVHELRACVELAERRGVVVSLDTCGDHPIPPVEIRRALTNEAMRVLATAEDSARVTVLGTPDTVTVSVVARKSVPVQRIEEGPVTVTCIEDGGRIWVEAVWRRQESW
ncbi:hypothetical protein Lesp02_25590 [Lentzea sp. NBRC 105346]|uniref:hypothetical protein n=1 Tax=Lentzea sp. NBRC 105346 TaxID=3032205 RepID=UPI00255736E3|nr:hypothetical protein [Lentzea sp. NBRC 105346]GLZ30370.1 hypothetical protein Lesp02_25590 [Lentzea sp. NBRC 105346]